MIPRGSGGQGRSTLPPASARSHRAVRCTGVGGPGTGTDSLTGTRPRRARLHPHAALDTTAAQARRRFPCEVRTIRRLRNDHVGGSGIVHDGVRGDARATRWRNDAGVSTERDAEGTRVTGPELSVELPNLRPGAG